MKREWVYCLSHATTLGITKVIGNEVARGHFRCVHGKHLPPNAWTRDPEEALAMAKIRQVERIKGLQRELSQAIVKEFKVPE